MKRKKTRNFRKKKENPTLYFILAILSLTIMRNTFWLPYHTELAMLTSKKNRGKSFNFFIYRIFSFYENDVFKRNWGGATFHFWLFLTL